MSDKPDPNGKFSPAGWAVLAGLCQFLAILYIGPKSSRTYSKLTKASCADQEYMQMRLGRMKISAGPNADTAGAKLPEFCSKLLAGE